MADKKIYATIEDLEASTPIKGVDYYTEQEKQDLINEILAALPSAEEASF